MRVLLVIMAIIMGIQSDVWAQKLDYPELNVTPRASTRSNMEMKWESENALSNTWPLAAAGLGTIFAASGAGDVIDDEKDPDGYAQTIGYAVGGVTLAVAAYGYLKYRPYKSVVSKLKKITAKDTRGKLTRERIAEEEIKRLQKIGIYTRVTLSLLNIGALSNISSKLTDDNAKKDDKDAAALTINIAQVAALLPLLFSTRYESVHWEQQRYKKRIYAPVSYAPILNDPFNGNKLAGGFGLNYRY